jgi:hypothetical protein
MEPVWSLVCSTCETPAPASAPHTAPSETPVPDAGQRASGTAGQWDSRPMGQRVRHGTAGQWDSQQSLCDTTPSYHYSLWPFMSECECIKSSSESESGKTPAPEPELDRGFASSPSSTRSHAALQVSVRLSIIAPGPLLPAAHRSGMPLKHPGPHCGAPRQHPGTGPANTLPTFVRG